MGIKEELLPDFDTMDALANVIAQYKLLADKTKLELDSYIAGCIQTAYIDKDCWVNGKPPTQTFIDNVVKVVGNTPIDREQIKTLTEQYRQAQRSAEESSNLLETMRNKVSVFQTVSANQRGGLM
jgi:hypothetical protein